MTETVIDKFETIDIQVKDRKMIIFPSSAALNGHVQMFPEQGAVG